MILDDTYAYIPLFAVSVISAVLFLLFISIRKKNTARISFIAFFATLIVIAGSIYSAVRLIIGAKNAFLIFGTVMALAILVIIPYGIMLCTFEPQKFIKLVPHSVNEAAEEALKKQQEEERNMQLKEKGSDSKILQLSYEFSEYAASVYAAKDGINDLLTFINKGICKEIGADGGAILMIDDFEDVITVKSFEGDFPPPYKLPSDIPHKPIRVATNFKFASFPLRDNIFGEIATSGKAELITSPEGDSRIFQNEPEDFLKCGTYIFAPLKMHDNVIGVLAFATAYGKQAFTEEKLEFVNALSNFASAAIKSVITVKETMEHNDLEKEAQLATNIQSMFHPTKLPVVQGIEMGTIWNQEEGVCGDYYDVIVSRKDRVSFVMSDVAGKGMNSVVIMTMLRAMIRLVVNTKKTAGTILEWVNHGISAENFSTDHFASCALINYDPTKRQVEIATGGSIPVYYFDSQEAKFTCLSTPTEPIGVDKESKYKDILQDIKTGDMLITYTDGLIEALNDQGQQYSIDSLFSVVSKNSRLKGKDIANLVKSDIKKFIGNVCLHDDQSLLLIKF